MVGDDDDYEDERDFLLFFCMGRLLLLGFFLGDNKQQ